MHFEGKQTINAPIQTVWTYFMDPEKLAQCAPGFKSMETLEPDHYKATLAVGIGAVRSTFTLDVKRVDVRELAHIGMQAHGSAAGSGVDMRSGIDLNAESENVTSMQWTADVNVSGMIASVGARLMEGTAQKLTAQFFDCLRRSLEAPANAGS